LLAHGRGRTRRHHHRPSIVFRHARCASDEQWLLLAPANGRARTSGASCVPPPPCSFVGPAERLDPDRTHAAVRCGVDVARQGGRVVRRGPAHRAPPMREADATRAGAARRGTARYTVERSATVARTALPRHSAGALPVLFMSQARPRAGPSSSPSTALDGPSRPPCFARARGGIPAQSGRDFATPERAREGSRTQRASRVGGA